MESYARTLFPSVMATGEPGRQGYVDLSAELDQELNGGASYIATPKEKFGSSLHFALQWVAVKRYTFALMQ